MPEQAMVNFINKLGPELLFCIGIIGILAYIAVKSIPIVRDIRLKQLEYKMTLEKERLELDRMREENAVEAAKKEDERDRKRNEVIAAQNEIMTSLVRSNEATSVQLASLNSSLLDSKDRSKILGDTVNDTNHKVTDTNRMVYEIHDALIDRK